MAWANVHDDAPLNDDGVPIHPEKGYPICGYEKTDAVDKSGGKRTDIPYCLQAAGWGTDRTTGHCKAHFGGSPGAPTGWRNGNARHLLYSEEMSDEDAKVFEALVEGPDGERMSIADAADILKNMIGWEATRLKRAIEQTPGVERIDFYYCPSCGDKKKNEPGGVCGNRYMTQDGMRECTYEGDFDEGDSFVDFGDKAVERKESHVANLMRTLKQLTEGTHLNVTGTHDVTHKGDADEPVEVSITHAGVDLPDEAKVDEDDGGEDE